MTRLESRSRLLDAAFVDAVDANRRWEECLALIDQSRVKIDTLRAELSKERSE